MGLSDIKDWIEIFQKIKRLWASYIGLTLGIIATLGVYYPFLKPFVVDLSNFILPKYSLFLVVITPIILVTAVITAWLIYRRLPKFSNNEIGILFCPLTDEKTADVANRLKNSLHRQIKEFGLDIKLKTLPANYEIKDNPYAHQIREKTNAHLIIWGQFCAGNIKDRKTVGFPKISFTFKQPPILLNLAPNFGVEIGIGIFGKQWFVQESNDFWDVENLSNNLTEATLNILGKILLLNEEFDKSQTILTHLLDRYLQPKENSTNPFMKDFLFSVRRALAYSYRGKSLRIYRSKIFEKISDAVTPLEDIKSSLSLIETAIKLDPNNGDHYLSSGILNFLLGNMKLAIDDIAKARNYNFRQDGVSHLSGAFLYIFKEDINKGLTQYKRAVSVV